MLGTIVSPLGRPLHKIEEKQQKMAKKISDLIEHIKSELNSAHAAKTVKKGEKDASPVPSPEDKDLSNATDDDLKAAAKHAIANVLPKWQTDEVVRVPLKIKGDKMVKSITDLKKKK